MKKVLLLLVAGLFVVAATSCSKQCTCTTTYMGKSYTYSFDNSVLKANGYTCSSYESVVNSAYSYAGGNFSCK